MKFLNPMLVVTDIDKSVEFYKRVLGLEVVQDFGANKTLTGSLALWQMRHELLPLCVVKHKALTEAYGIGLNIK